MKKLALITGGTSGIGLGIGESLAETFHLALAFRSNQERAKSAKELLLKKFPDTRIEIYGGALVDKASCQGLVEKVRADFAEEPAVLVNAAGGLYDHLFIGSDTEDHERLIREHLFVPMTLSHLVIEEMYKNGFGRIINLSSVAAHRGNVGQTSYSAAKAGIEGFTRSLALEVAHRGITVNALAPGLIESPMTEKIIQEYSSKKQDLKKMIPCGFIGQPRDVGELAAFLCSEGGRYITGQVITIDGGRSLRGEGR